ncbi:hypothetical protein F7C95_02475 [Opitutia bacterium ISCC 51]|nr:hypothetical protein F7C95_02475 [Opitutae bacterium ISCC 51]QXD28859.1 hypothetical protein GA003_02455 [Opitutae bacterium ISCC 52]
MITLFKILIATLILTSCAISIMSFDMASLSVQMNGDFLNFFRENDLAIGIIGGILLIGFIAQKRMATEDAA